MADQPVTDMTFEQIVAELESVAQTMDNGTIGIEAATELYARASELHAAARQRLVDVTSKVEALRGPAS
jgi:exodeoxyribonuclease VII small subunit